MINIDRDKFQSYFEIQNKGTYNMLDPRARQLTSLTKEEWMEILKNYDKYKDKYK
tara:strand:+ start:707 stop:871 length:165 start_codon:yes stop_codon:yes gene_type:complete